MARSFWCLEPLSDKLKFVVSDHYLLLRQKAILEGQRQTKEPLAKLVVEESLEKQIIENHRIFDICLFGYPRNSEFCKWL